MYIYIYVHMYKRVYIYMYMYTHIVTYIYTGVLEVGAASRSKLFINGIVPTRHPAQAEGDAARRNTRSSTL